MIRRAPERRPRISRVAVAAAAYSALALSACRPGPEDLRVLVFAIDGAGYDLTRAMMDRGELPHLERLRRRGAFGPLRSIEPMLSPALWTTFATGKRRARHGIEGFTAPGGTLHTSERLRVRRLWDIAGAAGRSVGVVNWWVTWPVAPVEGFVVSNLWPTSRNMILEYRKKNRGLPGGVPLAAAHYSSTYPTELISEIDPFIVEDADIDPAELEALKLSREEYRFIWDLPEMKSRTAAGLHLYESRRPDLFLTYYWILDHVEHQYFAVDREPVRRVYRRLDEILGRFLALAGDGAIVVVASDHGFRAVPTPEGPRSEHDPLGILFLSGPNLRAGAAIAGAGIEDVMPTLLVAMGLPVAADMDGRVIRAAFAPDFLAGRDLDRIATYDDVPPPQPLAVRDNPFAEELEQRLRELGYLE